MAFSRCFAVLLLCSLLVQQTASLASRPSFRGSKYRKPATARSPARRQQPKKASSVTSPVLRLPTFFSTSASSSGRAASRSSRSSKKPSSPKFELGSLSFDAITLDGVKEGAQNLVAEIRPLQIVAGFALSATLTLGGLVSVGNSVSGYLSEGDNGAVLERTLKFGTILENVKAAYVDQNIDIDALFQTGVNSMLSTLDPYSTYENAQQADDLALRTTGKYGGVGLTIGKDNDGDVLVLGALEGFAFDAGVRPGDRILKIDETEVGQIPVDKVKDLLRGEPGTTVQLTVQRDGAPEPTLTMPVQRKLVRLPDVTLATLDAEGVGYMKLEGFSEGTAEETARAIKRMQDKAAGGGLKALVLDMRDNPGGLLDAAVAVSQQLVPEGTEIVSTSGRVYGEGTSISYRSTRPPLLDPRTRLVVLVNSNTASAAEIVTGVVQDTDRGVVVGERTYGKGLVQIVEPLPGGGSLKLTVAKYYTPSGRCIQAVSYAGGRLEASAALPKKGAEVEGVSTTTTTTPEGAGDVSADPSSSSSSSSKKSGGPSSKKSSSSSGGGSTSGSTGKALTRLSSASKSASSSSSSSSKPEAKDPVAGAVQRIEPGDPSKPSATPVEDGSQFITAHGREVKGGGGIAPDVLVEAKKLLPLERALLQKGYFFDFSGEWLKRHAAPVDVLAKKLEGTQGAAVREEAYREFQAFVRDKLANGDDKLASLEPAGLRRQLDALEKAIETSGDLPRKGRAVKELASLRKTLQDEQLDEFKTDKETLSQDVTEALLGRLTAPSLRLASQLATDPQVAEAGRIASDAQTYQKLLMPEPGKPLREPTNVENVDIFPLM